MSERTSHGDIEDLVDFYNRWPDLRPVAMRVRTDDRLKPEEQDILNWMILMIDRVGPADLSRDKED